MDGDRQNQATNSPPSLTEPSQLRRTVSDEPSESTAMGTSEKAYGHSSEPPTPQDDSTETEHRIVVGRDEPVASFYQADAPTFESGEPAIQWVSSGDQLQSNASSWRLKMTLIAVVAGLIILLLTRDLVSAGSVLVVGVLFGMLGSRKSQPLAYSLDSRGITIGQKHYGYGDFRAFSITDDANPVVNLVPLRRFLPLTALRLDPAQFDSIVDRLAAHLPMEAHRRDAVDHIIGRIKF